MYLKLSAVFEYLNCTPTSRCFIEAEQVLEANHLMLCGVKEKNGSNLKIQAHCVQSSGVKASPHEVSGSFIVTDHVEIKDFMCSCKAGASSCCKHVTATLLFCSRQPLENLDVLSCTDLECVWKVNKPKIEKQYKSGALHTSGCFNRKMTREDSVKLNEEQINGIFQLAARVVPDSEFSLQLKGRRQNINVEANGKTIVSCEYIDKIFNRSLQSLLTTSLDINTDQLPDCCKQIILSMKKENIKEAMICEQGSPEWKQRRKNRITGSTCHSIYTFKKNDWSIMLRNFFNSKNITTKQMAYGHEMEAVAFSVFQNNNPNYSIKKIGIMINQRYPWVAFSPDGIIFSNESPTRLLEIKCPYLGKNKCAEEVLPTLPYLNKDYSLKKKHSYYSQIQLGMAVLNLEYCDFIIYFSKDQTYLQITVPFDETFAKDLLVTTCNKYLTKMIHYICQQVGTPVM